MSFKGSLLRHIAFVALLAPVTTSAQPENPGWRHVRTVGMIDMAVVDAPRVKDKDVYRAAIASICAPKLRSGFCKVIFWSDEKLVPRALPMSDDQLNGMRANWTWNGSNGSRKLLFSCDIEPDRKQCFEP